MKQLLVVLSLIVITAGCDTSKMSPTPDDQFIGEWQLNNRGMLEGIEVKISKDASGHLSGIITKLNDNKYVNMFMEVGDKFVSGVDRNSNFEFVLSEKKIAAPLFSAYGQSTTKQFNATFDGPDKILLGSSGAEGVYVKLK